SGLAQDELTDSLTNKEKAFRDSIAQINQKNATTAESHEAYNQGISFFQQKKYTQAIAAFNKAIKTDPSFEKAYYNKGVAENEANKYTSAIQTFSKLLSINPNYNKAYFQRARAYQGGHNFVEAEKDYKKAKEVDAKNPKVYYNYGGLLF